MYDYNARYYDPAIGRFIQPDTAPSRLRVPRPCRPELKPPGYETAARERACCARGRLLLTFP